MEHTSKVLKSIFLFLCSLFAISAQEKIDIMQAFDNHWIEYQIVYGKTYENEDAMNHRKSLWGSRLLSMFQHNLRADMGLTGYRRGLNSFSDLSTDEILNYMTGFKPIAKFSQTQSRIRVKRSMTQDNLPQEVDWRNNGSVTPVRNQGTCGACWAFSALGSLEGLHHIKTGVLVELSPQNLIDCSQSEGNDGCDGGYMTKAFKYIKDNEGVDTEKSYPYMADEGLCEFRDEDVGATCKGYKEVPEGDEEALKQAVATVGPVATGIDASLSSFQEYKGGIYDDENCGKNLVHAVTVIGYGTEDGRDYWIIKNSWGTSWGMKGYMKLLRNADNLCGIASKASYPIV